MTKLQRKNNGFTLIELSIVLVIIGLLVGGVLTGRDLIQSARLRNAASTADTIKSKIILFKDMYRQLPGDTNKMWAIYGTDCAATSGNCNGDNNRYIGSGTFRQLTGGGGGDRFEDSCTLHHLKLTGFWDKPTSVTGCGSTLSRTNITNYPDLALKAYGENYFQVAAWTLYQAHMGNAVSITLWSDNFSGDYMFGGELTRFEARQIEDKFDDGMPASGKIFTAQNNMTGGYCVNGGYTVPASSVTWATNNPDVPSCSLHFWID